MKETDFSYKTCRCFCFCEEDYEDCECPYFECACATTTISDELMKISGVNEELLGAAV